MGKSTFRWCTIISSLIPGMSTRDHANMSIFFYKKTTSYCLVAFSNFDPIQIICWGSPSSKETVIRSSTVSPFSLTSHPWYQPFNKEGAWGFNLIGDQIALAHQSLVPMDLSNLVHYRKLHKQIACREYYMKSIQTRLAKVGIISHGYIYNCKG